MLSGIKNFLQNSSNFNHAMLGVSAIASLEMGARTVINLTQSGKKEDLTADLSGALFFGLAAANLFPGSRKAAGIAFIIRSFYEFSQQPDEDYRKEEYWLGRAITFFPDQAYQGYKKIKASLDLPSHPTWYALIALVALVGYYQFGGAISNYFNQQKSS